MYVQIKHFKKNYLYKSTPTQIINSFYFNEFFYFEHYIAAVTFYGKHSLFILSNSGRFADAADAV